MPTTTITLTVEAHAALSKLKGKGQSFSDVVLEHLRPRPVTCGELLDELEQDCAGVQMADPALMKAVRNGRGRRSNRPGKA